MAGLGLWKQRRRYSPTCSKESHALLSTKFFLTQYGKTLEAPVLLLTELVTVVKLSETTFHTSSQKNLKTQLYSTVHTNPLRKRFCETLFKLEEFENGAFWKWWRHYNDAIFLPIDLISSVTLSFIASILRNLIKSTVIQFIQSPSLKTLQLTFKKAKTYH